MFFTSTLDSGIRSMVTCNPQEGRYLLGPINVHTPVTVPIFVRTAIRLPRNSSCSREVVSGVSGVVIVCVNLEGKDPPIR